MGCVRGNDGRENSSTLSLMFAICQSVWIFKVNMVLQSFQIKGMKPKEHYTSDIYEAKKNLLLRLYVIVRVIIPPNVTLGAEKKTLNFQTH